MNEVLKKIDFFLYYRNFYFDKFLYYKIKNSKNIIIQYKSYLFCKKIK